MNWYEINMEPRDLLFFRDAKPMKASSIGEGARIPYPHLFYDALIASFHEEWPELEDWEFEHFHPHKGEKGRMRFGGLKTLGVFPVCKDEVYLPVPADIATDGNDVARLWKPPGKNNLPSPLDFTVWNDVKRRKEKAGDWISAGELNKYLSGEQFSLVKNEDLFWAECRPGIGIDPETHSTDEGKFYLAEYMRLAKGVSLKGFASCRTSRRGENGEDVIGRYFSGGRREFIFGGQRGTVSASATSGSPDFPSRGAGKRVKWVLLTPAIFMAGWRPGWVGDDGNLLLPADRPTRLPDERREDWRKKFGKTIKAKLVAARLAKPDIISGWNLRTGGPRAVRLTVPAGSVYYFEAVTEEDARALRESLSSLGGKSDLLGEKGYGFGVCGSWDLY